MKESIRDELWNLHRKADQTRSIHGLLKDRFSGWNKFVQIFTTIGSAIAAMLIFAKVPEESIIWVGMWSALVFLVSMLPFAIKFDDKIQDRGVAIKVLGKWIRDASSFLNTELEQVDDEVANVRKHELLDEYKSIMEATPDIPQWYFNKGKQKHLQKIEISKELSKNPFISIRSYKKHKKNKPNN